MAGINLSVIRKGIDRLDRTNASPSVPVTLGVLNGEVVQAAGGSGSGDVVGPSGATANAVALYDGTTGKLLKDGVVIGTAANNLVQLDGTAKLPAVDGSQLTNLPSGGGVEEYVADSTSGEEIIVKASGTGVTAARAGNVVSFTLPSGVKLVSAKIRIAGANLVSGAMIVDSGRGATNEATRVPAVVQAWREDTGATLAITTTLDGSDFDRQTVNNLNASATNCVRIVF